jgi:hypothetical protein
MKKKHKKRKVKKGRGVRNGRTVNYVCSECDIREDIPAEVVSMFDILDLGDPTVPPRFACEKCGGAMWPA